ncbi:MAG: MMPL family transporter [bacterium]
MDSSTLESKDDAGDRFGITGLPVAEDTFGVEMFIQMAVSAPLAMIIILLILLYFFRKLSLVLSPMIVGITSAISCMGLLIGFGNTVHIMSSMIPIFVLPIAVEDSVHILSQFYERYQKYRDPGKTIIAVMEELFTPMLYTSLTTIAGFASLALTPIPPVQTFGIFVALGVAFAWFFTIMFIPAYVTFIPRRRLETFGASRAGEEHAHHAFLSRRLEALGSFTYSRAKLIIGITAVAILFSAYGISRLKVNDNPTKWFSPGHPIRVADRVLNSHFGGTYLAYLVLQPLSEASVDPARIEKRFEGASAGDAEIPREKRDELSSQFSKAARERSASAASQAAFVDKMVDWAEDREDTAAPEEAPLWDAVLSFLSEERARADVFKRPEMLRYVERLDDLMVRSRVVGKTNSAATMVKHINRELRSGAASDYAIPGSARMIAECYMQAQSGHDPGDLWHLVTPDYGKANIWVQLKSGDNKDMETVVQAVDCFIKENPPPIPLKHQWAGLTYVNVEWQNKMVSGMLRSLMGSFATVFLMMAFLFRSMLWGLLCMVPLTVTIALIYALIGITGKDYDMPVAVLSSLTLGLAVDFSIHYLSRARELFREMGEWGRAVRGVAGETARAIARNVVVITLGFLPLLAAPLVPYQTVGFFMASIMCVSGVGTLVILPALMTVLQGVAAASDHRYNYDDRLQPPCTERSGRGGALIVLRRLIFAWV